MKTKREAGDLTWGRCMREGNTCDVGAGWEVGMLPEMQE